MEFSLNCDIVASYVTNDYHEDPPLYDLSYVNVDKQRREWNKINTDKVTETDEYHP